MCFTTNTAADTRGQSCAHHSAQVCLLQVLQSRTVWRPAPCPACLSSPSIRSSVSVVSIVLCLSAPSPFVSRFRETAKLRRGRLALTASSSIVNSDLLRIAFGCSSRAYAKKTCHVSSVPATVVPLLSSPLATCGTTAVRGRLLLGSLSRRFRSPAPLAALCWTPVAID